MRENQGYKGRGAFRAPPRPFGRALVAPRAPTGAGGFRPPWARPPGRAPSVAPRSVVRETPPRPKGALGGGAWVGWLPGRRRGPYGGPGAVLGGPFGALCSRRAFPAAAPCVAEALPGSHPPDEESAGRQGTPRPGARPPAPVRGTGGPGPGRGGGSQGAMCGTERRGRSSRGGGGRGGGGGGTEPPPPPAPASGPGEGSVMPTFSRP